MLPNDQNAWGLFPLGTTVATQGVLRELTSDDIITALRRHQVGDWGDVDKEDSASNDCALQDGGRLFSVYHTSSKVKFYVITEWDRSVTTVLLPHEY